MKRSSGPAFSTSQVRRTKPDGTSLWSVEVTSAFFSVVQVEGRFEVLRGVTVRALSSARSTFQIIQKLLAIGIAARPPKLCRQNFNLSGSRLNGADAKEYTAVYRGHGGFVLLVISSNFSGLRIRLCRRGASVETRSQIA